MKLTLYTLFLTLFILASPASYSASSGLKLDPVEIDVTDQASLQRGAKTFVNYCLSCHSASYMRYNRMAKDIGLTEEQVKKSLMFGPEKIGDTMSIAMRPDDAKKWFGVAPPDLSVIARARGTDWLYTYLRTFYVDDSKPIGTNNLVFKDSAMPHVLWQQQGYMMQDENGEFTSIAKKPVVGANRLSKDDFSPSSFEYKLLSAADNQPAAFDYNLMVRDLVNFLAYISEPSKIQRLALGPWVLLYILLFIVVAYFMKKAFWEDIH